MIDFKYEAQQMLDKAIKWRRDFHMNPEPSCFEFRTADIVGKHLESLGMEVRRDYAGKLPSAVGLLRGGQPGPTVALRADMDALRIQEASNPAYKSKVDGVMHACGHDCHTASLMGAAEILAKHRAALKGNVKFIFEPAEEDIGGASIMIKNGVLTDPKVDAAFALHVENDYDAGQVGISYGETQAASDRLIVKIKGKSVHGAYPQLGIDAMMIAAHFLLAIQTMMAREKDTFEHAVITFGQINGGTARNVVCGEVTLNGICRTLNPEMREMLNRRIDEILKGITSTFGGSYELDRQISYGSLYNTPEMTDLIKETALTFMKPEDIKTMSHALMGCESFSYFTQAVPGAMWRLGSGNTAKGIKMQLHTPCFDIDENCLVTAMALHSAIAYHYLEKNAK